jgi:hypothetical protein
LPLLLLVCGRGLVLLALLLLLFVCGQGVLLLVLPLLLLLRGRGVADVGVAPVTVCVRV